MSKENKPSNPKKAITPMFRVSFPQLFEAKAMDEKSQAKFGVTMLFPKDEDLTALKDAEEAALQEGIEKLWKGKKPKNLRTPFRDGDTEEDYCEKDGYPGHIFVRASSIKEVGVVDKRRNEIEDPYEVYAGCYARASIVAYPYDKAGNRGVAFGLQNVQKLKDGEAFSGRMKAEDEFDEYIDEDIDEYDEFDDE